MRTRDAAEPCRTRRRATDLPRRAQAGQAHAGVVVPQTLWFIGDALVGVDGVVAATRKFLDAPEVHQELVAKEVARLERLQSPLEGLRRLRVVLLRFPRVPEAGIGQPAERRRFAAGGELVRRARG